MKPIAAALAVALMGMGGVALAAPKSDSGPPDQAQANGPAPQAQANDAAPPAHANGPAPQAQNPAPPPQAKAKGHQRAANPVGAPPAQPPPAGRDGNPGAGQTGHGRPAPGETRGRGESRSTRAKSGACRFAGCRHGGPKPDAGASGGGAEQPQQPAAGQSAPPAGGDAPPGGSGERPGNVQRGTHGGGAFGDHQVEVPELGSVLGANQGGGEEVETTSGSFDSALPFTGLEVLLLAGIGALLWLLGVRLRRATA